MAVQFRFADILASTAMGMNLDHGGHLTHGSPVNLSGKYFQYAFLMVLTMKAVIDYAMKSWNASPMECKPKLIVAGASAYARKSLTSRRFREIADACRRLSDG